MKSENDKKSKTGEKSKPFKKTTSANDPELGKLVKQELDIIGSETKPHSTVESVDSTPSIWDDFKSRKISVFSLPPVEISYHFAFVSEFKGSLVCKCVTPMVIAAAQNAFKDLDITLVSKNTLEIKRVV